jgi:hypothetical protein
LHTLLGQTRETAQELETCRAERDWIENTIREQAEKLRQSISQQSIDTFIQWMHTGKH